jgi:flavin-binding protein dodecin
MKSTRRTKKPVSAEAIARMADKGEDISRFFTNDGKMMPPLVQRVNVDFAASMLEELDREAKELNISRQAVIKTLLRRALNEQYVATAARLAIEAVASESVSAFETVLHQGWDVPRAMDDGDDIEWFRVAEIEHHVRVGEVEVDRPR